MIIMNKTYTPELAPEVLHRLRDYAEPFQDLFRYPSQFAWSGVYLRGLLEDGERKSIEPMASRVPRPPQLLDVKDPEQALQQFVNQSPWDHQQVENRCRRVLAGPWPAPGDLRPRRYRLPQAGQALRRCATPILRPTGQEGQLPGGRHGPLRQPRGAFPRGVGCSCPSPGPTPPAHGAGRRPGGIPPRADQGPIALELLDQVRGKGLLPGDVVITDAGYGVSQEFRQGLEQRGFLYIAGVSPEMVVFTEEPRWDWPEGRPTGTRAHTHRLARGNPRPVSLKSLAESLPRRKVTWREGTKGKLAAKFAWVASGRARTGPKVPVQVPRRFGC